jgi:predicted nucleic acid-binding Zn ribbon protein
MVFVPIPESDITISPNSLIYHITILTHSIISDILSPYDIDISEKTIRKIFRNKLHSSIIWQGILSQKRCMYFYTENSCKEFQICNAHIRRDTSIDDDPMNYKENKWFCSKHIKGIKYKQKKEKKKIVIVMILINMVTLVKKKKLLVIIVLTIIKKIII